jgi:hypothetical protein
LNQENKFKNKKKSTKKRVMDELIKKKKRHTENILSYLKRCKLINPDKEPIFDEEQNDEQATGYKHLKTLLALQGPDEFQKSLLSSHNSIFLEKISKFNTVFYRHEVLFCSLYTTFLYVVEHETPSNYVALFIYANELNDNKKNSNRNTEIIMRSYRKYLANILLELGATPAFTSGNTYSVTWPLCVGTAHKLIVRDRPLFTFILQHRAITLKLFLKWAKHIIESDAFGNDQVFYLLSSIQEHEAQVKAKKTRSVVHYQHHNHKRLKTEPDDKRYFEVLKLFDLAICGLPMTKTEKHRFMRLFYCLEHRKSHLVNIKWVNQVHQFVSKYLALLPIYNVPSDIWSIVGRMIEPIAVKRTRTNKIRWMTKMYFFEEASFADTVFAEFYPTQHKFFIQTMVQLLNVVDILKCINKERVIYMKSQNWCRAKMECVSLFDVLKEMILFLNHISGPVVYALMSLVLYDPCYNYFDSVLSVQPLKGRRDLESFYTLKQQYPLFFLLECMHELSSGTSVSYVREEGSYIFQAPIDDCSYILQHKYDPTNILLKTSVAIPKGTNLLSNEKSAYVADLAFCLSILDDLKSKKSLTSASDFDKDCYTKIVEILTERDMFYHSSHQ